MRTRKPSDVSFPVPKLGFQTDELVDTLIEAMSEKPCGCGALAAECNEDLAHGYGRCCAHCAHAEVSDG
jgi:hypothetical protein